MSTTKNRLDSLGIKLPVPSKPAANYVGFKKNGNNIVISGQLPIKNGSYSDFIGKLGKDFSSEQGKEIAKICAINILAQINDAMNGNLDHVRCVRIGVFINSTEEFTDHPQVANGASDFFVDVLGENGKHARFAVGVNSLPFGVGVEIDAEFEVIKY